MSFTHVNCSNTILQRSPNLLMLNDSAEGDAQRCSVHSYPVPCSLHCTLHSTANGAKHLYNQHVGHSRKFGAISKAYAINAFVAVACWFT